MSTRPFRLSVVVPLYNEAAGLEAFHRSLSGALESIPHVQPEIIYVDDGSTDNMAAIVKELYVRDGRIKFLKLSRNFGKESALTAGLAEARGEATIMLDGDGQHPVGLIGQFVEAWQAGAQVVVGVRRQNRHAGGIKRWGSKLFYRLFNAVSDQWLEPGSTDFRLLDRQVLHHFLQLKETDRVARSLIDWLGFRRQYVYFTANSRSTGQAGYDIGKLVRLAVHGLVAFSTAPLYIFGGLGVVITTGAFVLGLVVLTEQVLLRDPWLWRFTGTAMLGILLLFLIGIVLMSQGILAVYLSHVHALSKQRPLYVVDRDESFGLTKTAH